MKSSIENLRFLSDRMLETVVKTETMLETDKKLVTLHQGIVANLKSSINENMEIFSLFSQNRAIFKKDKDAQTVLKDSAQYLVDDIIHFSNNDKILIQQAQKNFDTIKNGDNIDSILAFGELINSSIEILNKIVLKARFNEMTLECNQLRFKKEYQEWLNSVELIVHVANKPLHSDECSFLQFLVNKSILNLNQTIGAKRYYNYEYVFA